MQCVGKFTECPKFSVKNICKILQTFGFKSLVSCLGLGTFKSHPRLEFLLKVSVSSRSRNVSVSSRSRRFWPRPQLWQLLTCTILLDVFFVVLLMNKKYKSLEDPKRRYQQWEASSKYQPNHTGGEQHLVGPHVLPSKLPERTPSFPSGYSTEQNQKK